MPPQSTLSYCSAKQISSSVSSSFRPSQVALDRPDRQRILPPHKTAQPDQASLKPDRPLPAPVMQTVPGFWKLTFRTPRKGSRESHSPLLMELWLRVSGYLEVAEVLGCLALTSHSFLELCKGEIIGERVLIETCGMRVGEGGKGRAFWRNVGRMLAGISVVQTLSPLNPFRLLQMTSQVSSALSRLPKCFSKFYTELELGPRNLLSPDAAEMEATSSHFLIDGIPLSLCISVSCAAGIHRRCVMHISLPMHTRDRFAQVRRVDFERSIGNGRWLRRMMFDIKAFILGRNGPIELESAPMLVDLWGHEFSSLLRLDPKSKTWQPVSASSAFAPKGIHSGKGGHKVRFHVAFGIRKIADKWTPMSAFESRMASGVFSRGVSFPNRHAVVPLQAHYPNALSTIPLPHSAHHGNRLQANSAPANPRVHACRDSVGKYEMEAEAWAYVNRLHLRSALPEDAAQRASFSD